MRNILAVFLLLVIGFAAFSEEVIAESANSGPFVVPVVLVHYFPVQGSNIDLQVTGDWGESLELTKAKTARQTRELIDILQGGSRYRAYANPAAQPSLRYIVAHSYEFLEPLPTVPKHGNEPPMTDYKRIMERIGIRSWVEDKGVKEVWIWAYHGGKVNLWESNMSSPFGDVSNSDRKGDDLPVVSKTYTVYHYNYQRGTSEATENHVHQIEAVLNHIDGRDRTPPERWRDLLFWGRFVSSDKTHKIVNPGCGWAHYPPNGERDYDWANKRFVETEMDDWKPDGTGKKTRINCERWSCSSLNWFSYWMQHLPGPGNGLSFRGKPLNNWWVFIGDYDSAQKARLKLTGP